MVETWRASMLLRYCTKGTIGLEFKIVHITDHIILAFAVKLDTSQRLGILYIIIIYIYLSANPIEYI